MNEAITHPSDRTPLDCWIAVPERIGQLFRRIADNLDTADIRTLQGLILQECRFIKTMRAFQEICGLVEDVLEIFTR
jgi:Mg2+/Co2+ transporter CorB